MKLLGGEVVSLQILSSVAEGCYLLVGGGGRRQCHLARLVPFLVFYFNRLEEVFRLLLLHQDGIADRAVATDRGTLVQLVGYVPPNIHFLVGRQHL